MRIDEYTNPLDVYTPTVAEIAAKHKTTSAFIRSQLSKGINVEMEHTSSRKVAKEIALDHLSEFADYYDRLERAEQ